MGFENFQSPPLYFETCVHTDLCMIIYSNPVRLSICFYHKSTKHGNFIFCQIIFAIAIIASPVKKDIIQLIIYTIYDKLCFKILKILIEKLNVFNYFSLYKFFMPLLVVGISLKSEWQQVFLGLQDSSQYSCKSLQCCILYSLNLSSVFQLFQFLFQAFWDHSMHAK